MSLVRWILVLSLAAGCAEAPPAAPMLGGDPADHDSPCGAWSPPRDVLSEGVELPPPVEGEPSHEHGGHGGR